MDFESAKKLHLSFIENHDKHLQKLRMPINIDKFLSINNKYFSGVNNPFYASSHAFAFTKANYNFSLTKGRRIKEYFGMKYIYYLKLEEKYFIPIFIVFI